MTGVTLDPAMLPNVAKTEEPDEAVWKDWRRLVNMNASELRRFMDSPDGKRAGLSASEARAQGIDSGRESARWILKMQPIGRSYSSAVANWTPTMWRWSRKQVSFIKRMRGNKGALYRDGEPTRKLLSLKTWGHDPEKPQRR